MHHNLTAHPSAWHYRRGPSCRPNAPYPLPPPERYPPPPTGRAPHTATAAADPSSPSSTVTSLLPAPADRDPEPGAGEPRYLARCEWGSCPLPLDDTSPAGLQRHLREWHLGRNGGGAKTRRGRCAWAGGGCGKEMALGSLGKHVSYVHLRHSVRCPHCRRDVGRAGLLPLHLLKYCPCAPR